MRILDTTLRDGLMSQNVVLTLNDKVKIASLLDLAGIEIIEIAHILGKDFREELIVGNEISDGKVCVLTDTNLKNVQNAIDFIKKVKGGVIHIYSVANFQGDELNVRLKEIEKAILYAKDHVEAVQWTGFDGNQAEYEILRAQIKTAIKSGAKTISVPDSLGVHRPDAFESLVTRVINDFKSEQADFSVHCHDDLGFALENTVAGIRAGIQQAELTIDGIGARKGNCNLINLIQEKELSFKYNQEHLREAENIISAARAPN